MTDHIEVLRGIAETGVMSHVTRERLKAAIAALSAREGGEAVAWIVEAGDKVRGLVEKWRADAGEIGQKDAFDCGFARGHESCADELAAALGQEKGR